MQSALIMQSAWIMHAAAIEQLSADSVPET
jgi:hypothetical protein